LLAVVIATLMPRITVNTTQPEDKAVQPEDEVTSTNALVTH
jgi:hypothetical protein